MVVMEMDLPTGYIVLNDNLRDYVRSGKVPTLNRAEYYNRKIVFYLDYVSETGCLIDTLILELFWSGS